MGIPKVGPEKKTDGKEKFSLTGENEHISRPDLTWGIQDHRHRDWIKGG